MRFSFIDTFEDPTTGEIFEISQILECDDNHDGDPSRDTTTFSYVLSGNHATEIEVFHFELIQLINNQDLLEL